MKKLVTVKFRDAVDYPGGGGNANFFHADERPGRRSHTLVTEAGWVFVTDHKGETVASPVSNVIQAKPAKEKVA